MKAYAKAKAEQGVLVAERWILAALRHRTFFSLAEANVAIRERLAWLNERPFRKLDGCRQSLFTELDRPAMRPLPPRPYAFGVRKLAAVNVDNHVEVERHYYSVPYQLVGERCDVRISASTIEIVHRGRQVAATCAARPTVTTPPTPPTVLRDLRPRHDRGGHELLRVPAVGTRS